MIEASALMWVINIALTVAGVVLWDKIKAMAVQVKETQKELSDYKIAGAEKFATREDLRLALEDVKTILKTLDSKLDKLRDER